MTPPPLSKEQQKVLLLCGLGVVALLALMLAAQAAQNQRFWRELNEWRDSTKLADFFAWEREHEREPERDRDDA